MVEKEVTPEGLKKLVISYKNALKQIKALKEKQGETLRDEDTDEGIELRVKSFISQFKVKKERLSRQAKSLIRAPLWVTSRKNLKPDMIEQKEINVEGRTLKMEVLTVTSGQTTFEFVKEFSLPTVLTFKVVSAVSELFLKYGDDKNIFYISTAEVAKELQISAEGKNLTDIKIALLQIHNTLFTYSKLWPKTKLRIFTIDAITESDLKPYKIRFNDMIAMELKMKDYTLLDLSLDVSPGAFLLYSRLKQDSNIKPRYSLTYICELLNLRGAHRFSSIIKYANELRDKNFLKKNPYLIQKAKHRGKNITFYKSEGWKKKEVEIVAEQIISGTSPTEKRIIEEKQTFNKQKNISEAFNNLPITDKEIFIKQAEEILSGKILNTFSKAIRERTIKGKAIELWQKQGFTNKAV